MFPFVLGDFISRPTFDCLCERYLTMIPCMLYAEDFDCWATAWIDCSQALSYRRELTVHKLIFVHESTRFCLCSTEHLWIVSPQPRTPTRRRQSIDVFNHDSTCRNRWHRRESTKEVHGLVVRIAPVSFPTPAIVSALDSDWTIYYLLISNKWL